MSAARMSTNARQLPASAGTFFQVMAQHPVRSALGLIACHVALLGAGAVAFRQLLPETSGYVQSAILTLIVAAGWMLLLSRPGWAQIIGFVGVEEWHNLRLLLAPAVIALLPLAGGLHGARPGMLALMVSGYVATAIFEESLFRGVLLRLFLPRGAGRAVALSSLCFGVMHLQNVLFRDSTALVFSQAIGVFCFGVGYSVLRLRTNTIWPLVALHFVTDLLLQLTNLPMGAKISLMVGQDTALLVYGVVLLRLAAGTREQAEQPAGLAEQTSPAA